MNDSDRRRSPDGFDDDAIFADIVAHLKDDDSGTEPERAARSVIWEGPTGHGTRPETPDAPGDGTDRGTDEETAQESADEPASMPPGDSPAVPAPQGWRTHEVEEEEEHFEPPQVSPLPVGDLQFWAILAGMIGGPLLLVYLVFFNRNLSHYWTLISIAMSVGGFVLLVSRLPGQDDEDDDDGARL